MMNAGAFAPAYVCQSAGISAVAPADDNHHIYFPRQLTRRPLSLHGRITNGFVKKHMRDPLPDRLHQLVSQSHRKCGLRDDMRLFHVWKPVYIFEGFYLEGMTHCPLRYALHFRVLLFTDEYDGLSISHEVFGDLLVPFDERARRVH